MPLNEEEKIKLIKGAFQRFFATVSGLLNEQRALFDKIMNQIAERKIAANREKLKSIFNSKNKQ